MIVDPGMVRVDQRAALLPRILHPRDILPVRDALVQTLDITGKYPNALWMNDPDSYEMFFARPDFADLYKEMRATMIGVDAHSLLDDIMAEKGDHGAMVIGFDDRHQPRMPLDYTNGVQQLQSRPTSMTWMMFTWDKAAQDNDGQFAGAAIVMPSPSSPHRNLLDRQSTAGSREATLVAWMLLNAHSHTLVEQTTLIAGAGLPPKAKKVLGRKANARARITVIDLRRVIRKQMTEVADADRRHIDHRFIVRGHWRKQPYGVGRQQRRNVFIAPYVKGDPSMPFIKREKVFRY